MTQPKPAPPNSAGSVSELRSLDDDVATYLEITERMSLLGEELAAVRHRLADRGVGKHATASGVQVIVTPPNRSFNADKAWGMLSAAQQKLCMSRDNSKIKGQLPPVLTEQCMEPGTGTPRVVVK